MTAENNRFFTLVETYRLDENRLDDLLLHRRVCRRLPFFFFKLPGNLKNILATMNQRFLPLPPGYLYSTKFINLR